MTSWRAVWRTVVPVVAAVGLAGCGSSSATSVAKPSTTTSTVGTLAQRYRAVVTGGNRGLQVLSKQLNQANGNVAQIQVEFRSVSATYHRVATQVSALRFPAAMQAHVAAMVAALDALSADGTQGAQAVTPTQFDAVFAKLAADQKTEVTANNAVNHDLGISAIN